MAHSPPAYRVVNNPMATILPGLIGIFLYLTGAALQCSGILYRRPPAPTLVRAIAMAAALAHGVLVWQLMFANSVDLSLFRAATLVTLTMVVLILALGFSRPLDNIFVVLFPMAALSLVLALTINSRPLQPTSPAVGFAVHTILAILAYATLSLAACQSLLVSWQESSLRHRQHLARLKYMPPLQTMEQLLFELLWIGLTLLTLAITSGFLFLNDMFEQRVVHHTVLSISSWVVFAILLTGRQYFGWRGKTAIRWTLTGFVLLMLAYFGSKFVIEVILNN